MLFCPLLLYFTDKYTQLVPCYSNQPEVAVTIRGSVLFIRSMIASFSFSVSMESDWIAV